MINPVLCVKCPRAADHTVPFEERGYPTCTYKWILYNYHCELRSLGLTVQAFEEDIPEDCDLKLEQLMAQVKLTPKMIQNSAKVIGAKEERLCI